MARQLIEKIATANNVIALLFQAQNIPDAAGTAKSIEVTTDDYIMPFAGSVIGIGSVSNAALVGGTVTFNPTVNGTADTALGATLDSSNQRAQAKIESRRVNFAAGQRVGVKWTKTGTVNPTTNDVSIIVLVVLEDMDF